MRQSARVGVKILSHNIPDTRAPQGERGFPAAPAPEVLEGRNAGTSVVTSSRLLSRQDSGLSSRKAMVGFGDYLSQNKVEAFGEHYIDYHGLKAIIADITKEHVGAQKRFIDSLEREWNKFHTHYRRCLGDLRGTTITDDRGLKTVVQLNDFAWVNHEAARKIIKKHDKNSRLKLKESWQFKFNYSPDPIILTKLKEFSDQQKEMRADTGLDRRERPDESSDIERDFVRQSRKYWVKQSDVVNVVGEIVRHLPIYCYGDQKEAEHSSSEDSTAGSPLTKIDSVYFDNNDRSVYTSRLLKRENAKAFRIRWYDGDKKFVFMERKVHHESWVLEDSSKNRFKLPERNVLPFIRGKIAPRDCLEERSVELGQELQDMVLRDNLYPCVRTSYMRMAFQNGADNDEIRISLDLHLQMMRETTSHWEWYTPRENVKEDDIYHFPRAVVEIKLRGPHIDEPPEWIQKLIEGGKLKGVDRFSKFAHGTYMLEHVQEIKQPYWIAEHPDVFTTSASDEADGRPQRGAPAGGMHQSSCFECMMTCGASSGVSERVKIEPKTFFANERTFLQWFNAAVFVQGFGVALLTLDQTSGNTTATSAKPVGYVMVGIALLLLVYSAFTYHKRNIALNNFAAEGYQDK